MWSHAHDKGIPENWCFWQRSFWRLSKRKGWIFIMPCLALVILSFSCHALLWSCFATLCHASPDKICTKDKNFQLYNWFPTFWRQKEKFTIHLSLFTVTIHPLLFMTLFTPNFCLFKGGCPLYLEQVLLQVFFPRESYHLWAFLWEISLLTITSLQSL